MNILTLKHFKLELPEEIRKELHLEEGQKVLAETTKDNVILIKPLKLGPADTKLLELLGKPVHMGKIKYKSRKDIYSDID